MTKKRDYYYLYVVWIYLLIFRDVYESWNIPLLSYVDEFYALLSVVLIIKDIAQRHGRLVLPRSKKLIIIGGALFLFCGLLSGVVFGYQTLLVTLFQAFLSIKFWFAIITTCYMFRNFSLKENAGRILIHLKIIAILLFILLCADQLFHVFPSPGERYGIRISRLIFGHPTTLAAASMFLMLLYTSIKPYVRGGSYILIICAVLLIFTLRAKAIGGLAVFWLIYLYSIKGKRKLNFFVIALAGVALAAIAWDQISYYFIEIKDESARYQLISKSFIIAKDHFPLGSGFGTFGSYMSEVYYSPLYYTYNLSSVYGLGEGGNFINDTFWPMIIGESGVIGTIAYLMMLLGLYLNIQKISKVNKYTYTAALMALVYLLISSTSESAFAHPFSVSMAFIIGTMFVQKPDDIPNNHEIKSDRKM